MHLGTNAVTRTDANHPSPWQAVLVAVVCVLGVVCIALAGVFGRMQVWLVPVLKPLVGGTFAPLLYGTFPVVLLLSCAAAVWTLRRWLRCPLWQPQGVAQELLFTLAVLAFGGELLSLLYVTARAAYPVSFDGGAGVSPVRLALLLLAGRGAVLLCLGWLWCVLTLTVCYACWGEAMRRWCAFGRMARRVVATSVGLLPLAGAAVLVDHAVRMGWKFAGYNGESTVSLFVIALFAGYALVVACIVYTAGQVYADRLLRTLAFVPVLLFLLFLSGIAAGVFQVVVR